MVKAHNEESCLGGPGVQCGHIDAEHTPASRSDILDKNDSETARILGGLTDAQQANLTTALNQTGEIQGVYRWAYNSGEITGKITLEIVARLTRQGFVFVNPQCSSASECTILQDINVEHCGGMYFCGRFIELPQPIIPSEENIYWSDGYVRCGMSSRCPDPGNVDPTNLLQYDDPYNWPAHPTVHWGKWDFLFELRMLANKWYEKFKRPLVINDISLPKGGLLDCKTPDKPNWNVPHKSHRKGVDADILMTSVPNSIRPTGGSTDTKWLDLYKKYKLLESVDLIYSSNPKDYNHLLYTGGNTQY